MKIWLLIFDNLTLGCNVKKVLLLRKLGLVDLQALSFWRLYFLNFKSFDYDAKSDFFF